MKKLKVTIQDQNTLVLQEDGQQGDIIDLKSLHDIDIDKSHIDQIIKSIKNDEFNTQLEAAKRNLQTEVKLKEQEIISRAKEAIAKKEQEIATLNVKIENIAGKISSDEKLKNLEQLQKLERDYHQKLEAKENEIKETKHQKDLIEKDLLNLKEMRARQSTKMIGESLELHCENEFNKIKALAFPTATFGKDNTISATGSKGDYIYRELDENGDEILSIMFEMKNQDDLTATKHKNKDFFKELDKDRTEKNCEYAVLVSLLETDNPYYDDIVTVHEYPKMYSIRPQHFITIIGFLRLANLKTQQLSRTIHELKNRNIDVTNFENNLRDYKEGFDRNYNLASTQFAQAIKEIDTTIDHLNKVKDNLYKSINNLRLANNKVDALSIKKLTAGAPSVATAIAQNG